MEGNERVFPRWEGRERKESLVACGSNRDCWLMNESRPMIGYDEYMVVVAARRRRRTAAAAPAVVAIFVAVGSGLYSVDSSKILGAEIVEF